MLTQIPETCPDHTISLPAPEEPRGCSLPAQEEPPRRNARNVQRIQRAQWLRAAILGANDGLLSTALLVLGVGAATENQRSIILSGVAGSVAGACSMAVGEFMSVSTQRDIEMSCRKSYESDLSKTIKEEQVNPKEAITTPERVSSPKLPAISPGRSPIMKVIVEDETTRGSEFEDNYDEEVLPNPIKAAGASAFSFICGSIVPLLSTVFVENAFARMAILGAVTSVTLVLFGGVGAYLGGAPVKVSAVRVLIGGWLAMALTYGLLKLLDRDDIG